MSRSFGGLYFTRRNHIDSKFSHFPEENNVYHQRMRYHDALLA